jgi:hypothetical protein
MQVGAAGHQESQADGVVKMEVRQEDAADALDPDAYAGQVDVQRRARVEEERLVHES